MTTTRTLLGIQSPGDELEIRDLRRIKRVEEATQGLFDGSAGPVWSETSEVLLNAWSGKTGDGHPVHLSYRIGMLAIDVDLPTPHGGREPLALLRWKPRLALGLAVHPTGTTGHANREERARLAESAAELAEIRALNGTPRILGEGELLYWLAERNRHFAFLSERGLAGGKLRFRIQKPEKATEAA